MTAPQPTDLWQEAPCGLLVAATDGTILRANLTLCRWLGYEPWELVGRKRLPELMPMGARVFLQTHWVPLLQIQGSVSEVQLDLLHKDRSRLPMMLSAIRRERDGVQQDEVALLIATDRKAYERELLATRARLHEANEALSAEHHRKDEFLAILAHELRNPLAPVVNVIETMKLKGDDPVYRARALQVLSRQVTQMTRLTDDLLNVARISQGKIALRMEPADIVKTLQLTADEALPAMEQAGQTLQVLLPAAGLWANADLARLTQIVANLLNNASKYSPRGASVQLAAYALDGMAVIDVRDDGMGIPPAQLARIFDMFAQLAPASEHSQGGLGIGLSLVKGLVELHGGDILAHSEGEGKGSCFTVRLPLVAAPFVARQAAPAPAVKPAHIDGLRVMVADDNIDAVETIMMGLELLGYQASGAHDGRQTLQTMERVHPDAALLDIGLPDMSGYQLARAIRAAPWGADVKLIAVTGLGQDADKQAALDAGFNLHLTKPVDFLELDRHLQALCQRRPGDGA